MGISHPRLHRHAQILDLLFETAHGLLLLVRDFDPRGTS
jgi:hypothetical protein